MTMPDRDVPSIVINDEAGQVKAAAILIRRGKAEITPDFLDAVDNQAAEAMTMLIPNTRMTLLAGEVIPLLTAELRRRAGYEQSRGDAE